MTVGRREKGWEVSGAIVKAIGRTERAVYHVLEKGGLPGVRKLGGTWCLDPEVFRATMREPGSALQHANGNRLTLAPPPGPIPAMASERKSTFRAAHERTTGRIPCLTRGCERLGITRNALGYADDALQPIKVGSRKFYSLARLRTWAIKRRNNLQGKPEKQWAT